MSNKTSFNWISNQRVDKPHLKAIESSVVFDFAALLKGFVNTSPYILNGFNVDNAPGAILGPASGIQIVVSGANIWMPGDANGSFLNVPVGQANEPLNSTNSKVTGSFTSGAINYVSVIFTRAPDPTTADLVAVWDVDAQVEFSQTVPLGNVLNYQFVINTTGFGTGAPLAIVSVNSSGAVISIENAKSGLFRLGTGGTSPDPDNISSVISSTLENPLIVSSPSGSDPFIGGDWQISNWKQWMDAVMTKLKDLSGSIYWYATGSTLVPNINLSNVYFDAIASKITGAGSFYHSSLTPGQLSWTSQLNIRSIFGPLTMVVPAGSVTLNNGGVAYISLVRNQDFQPTNTFTFTNGSTTVAASSSITGISAGNWIKAAPDNVAAWAQIASVSGSTITLTAAYSGLTFVGKDLRTQDTYSMSSASPLSIPVNGDTYWIAKRDDNAFSPLTIAPIMSSGATRATNVATIITTTAHGLVIGQAVSITGVSDSTFDGTFTVASVPTTTSFTYANDSGPDVPANTAGGGSVSSVPAIYLRNSGEGTLIQGDNFPIDGDISANILSYIGSPSSSASAPVYASATIITQGASLTEAISQLDAVLGAPSYSELYAVVASSPGTGQILPISSGSNLTIPVNTRLTGSPQQYYVVGKGNLEVRLNGQVLDLGFDWAEIGTAGTPSKAIQINSVGGLVAGDHIEFRLIIGGASGSGGGGGGGGVTSLNSITGTVTLLAGSNISITPSGSNIIIGTTNVASTSLNNLTTTSVNQSLIPQTAGVQTLGSASLYWGPSYLQSLMDTSAVTSVDPLNRKLFDTTGAAALNWANRTLLASDGTTVMLNWATANQFNINGQTVINAASISDTSSNLSIAATARQLYANDGTTSMMNWATASTLTVTSTNLLSNNILLANSGNYVGFRAPTLSSSQIWTLPALDGSANQVLSTNGAGVLGWSSISSSSANQHLSNLSSVALNADIIPASFASANLGSTAIPFNGVFARSFGIYDAGSSVALNIYESAGKINIIAGSTYNLNLQTNNSILLNSASVQLNSSGIVVPLQFYDTAATNYVGFQAPAALTGNQIWTLPTADGSSNQVLQTNGAGVLGWATVATSTPGGSANYLQYNGGGTFAGNANFQVDTTYNALNLNGLRIAALSSAITIVDNTTANLFAFPASFTYAVVEYSVVRNGVYRVGRMLIANDGSTVALTDDDTVTGGGSGSDIVWTASISGSNVQVQYSSSSSGHNATFKYSIRMWS